MIGMYTYLTVCLFLPQRASNRSNGFWKGERWRRWQPR